MSRWKPNSSMSDRERLQGPAFGILVGGLLSFPLWLIIVWVARTLWR